LLENPINWFKFASNSSVIIDEPPGGFMDFSLPSPRVKLVRNNIVGKVGRAIKADGEKTFIYDISETGVRLILSEKLERDAVCWVHVPGVTESKLKVKVVWSKRFDLMGKYPYMTGFRFVNPTADQVDAIRIYVKKY
jgi:hypothetical protein